MGRLYMSIFYGLLIQISYCMEGPTMHIGTCDFSSPNETCGYLLDARWTAYSGDFVIGSHKVINSQGHENYVLFDARSPITNFNETGIEAQHNTTYSMFSPEIVPGMYKISFETIIATGASKLDVLISSNTKQKMKSLTTTSRSWKQFNITATSATWFRIEFKAYVVYRSDEHRLTSYIGVDDIVVKKIDITTATTEYSNTLTNHQINPFGTKAITTDTTANSNILTYQTQGPSLKTGTTVCPTPPTFSNSFVSINSTEIGSFVIYQCYLGFLVNGIDGRITGWCLSTGNWSIDITSPPCQPKAITTDTTANSNILTYQTQGLSLKRGTTAITTDTTANSNILTYQTQGPSLKRGTTVCPTPPTFSNSFVSIFVNSTEKGSFVIYQCYPGFLVNGTDGRIIGWCLSTGNWSIDITSPPCQPKAITTDTTANSNILNNQKQGPSLQTGTTDCAIPHKPENGGVYYNSTLLYGKAVFFCDVGYTLQNESTQATCNYLGKWSNEVPVCSIVVCPEHFGFNGVITYENANRTYGTSVNLTCYAGYDLIGLGQRICQNNGMWSGLEPQCLRAKPEIVPCPQGKDLRGTTWRETRPGRVVVLKCINYDNKTNGHISRNCTLKGVWKPPIYSCVRVVFEKAEQEILAILNNPTDSGVQDALSTLSNLTSNEHEILEGEMEKTTDILETIANIKSPFVKVTKRQSEDFFSTASNMLDLTHENTWTSIAQNSIETKEPRGAAKVLKAIDSYAEAISDSLSENETQRIFNTTNIDLKIARIGTGDKTKDIDYSPSENNRIFLSRNDLQDAMSYSVIVYKDLTGIMSNHIENDGDLSGKGELGSAVLALSLLPQARSNFVTPVKLTFRHIQVINHSRPECSFWNYESHTWDTEGCSVFETSKDVTTCQCTHLTNFAILMSPWTEENVDTLAITLISYITCGLSAFCLLVTVGIHVYLWRFVKADRVVILIHLSVALVFSYISFLSGVKETDNEDVCTAVALILHYIYLVVFFLMLAEGIEIGVTILYVFVTKSRLKWILPLAWGIPAAIVGISAGITGLDGYGTDTFCWLSVENYLIWAFVGPAALIIMINLILLILIMRAMFKTKSFSKTSNFAKTKAGIRCLCVLLPLMGCSWLIGVFYVSENVAWLQYAFAACNGLQGVVIFTFHVVLNEKIRKAIRTMRRKNKKSIPTSRSSKPSTAVSSEEVELKSKGMYPVVLIKYSDFNE